MNQQCAAPALPVIADADPADRLARLSDAHYDRLYRLARRLAPNADDALDLVQEAFLRAARCPKSIPRGASNEEAWLVRVLINIRRDQWRRVSVRARHQETALQAGRHDSNTRNPEPALIARAAVWQALDVLPPRRRAIVVMHELEELPVSKIASLLGISAITVRWHLAMGRRDLARALKTSGGLTHE
ncbi:MAG TPA: sigma-70 family RNA polymerase sigma factor [Terriglobia bacterium]|nr:sigma-70 family RNA polymerase sigma factor [Terriglobia bacterium]